LSITNNEKPGALVPQWGQRFAVDETSFPHSLHFVSAISNLHLHQ